MRHHRMSAHTKFEGQRGPVAATRADRRVPDHSPGHAERTSVRGGAKNGFTWGVGCTGDAKSWTCGRPRAEFSTRKSDQTTALARSRGPLGTISMLLEGLRAAHSPGTVFGWRTKNDPTVPAHRRRGPERLTASLLTSREYTRLKTTSRASSDPHVSPTGRTLHVAMAA